MFWRDFLQLQKSRQNEVASIEIVNKTKMRYAYALKNRDNAEFTSGIEYS